MSKEESVFDEKEWIKQESEFNLWKPESEGDFLTGEIVDDEMVDIGGDKVRQLKVKTDEGKEFTTPGNKVLQTRLKKAKVGDIVRIVYTHQEAPKVRGQNPTMFFDVFIKKN